MPTVDPTLGLSELGLADPISGKDGVLYVPTTYLPDTAVPLFVALLRHFFPPPNEDENEFLRGPAIVEDASQAKEIMGKLDLQPMACRGALKYVIHTSVGEGPKVLSAEDSLLDDNGMPKNV